MMKTKLLLYSLLIDLVLVASLSAETIKVSMAEDWVPFQYMENNMPKGLDIELISAICTKAGFDIEFQPRPWARTLYDLKTGKSDLGLGVSKNSKRMKYAYFSDSYRLGFNALFIRVSEKEKYKEVKSLKDLIKSKITIGVRRGVSYSTEYDNLIKNLDFNKLIHTVNSDKQLIDMIIRNRIDVFLAGEVSGYDKIIKMGYDEKIINHMYLYDEVEAETFLMLSKKSITKAQVSKINAAIKAMKEDGTYQRIISNYTTVRSKCY